MPVDPPQGDARDLVLAPGSGKIVVTGHAPIVSLESEAARVVGSVADQIALKDADLRRWLARWVGWTFFTGNIVTLVVIGGLVWLDQRNIEAKTISPDARIIDRQVILGLLGATTVQVGTIAAIIVRYLFPGRSHPD